MSWDTSTPAGSEAISNGDNRIRELKTDLQTALQAQGSFPGADPSNPKYKWKPEYDTNANRPSSSLVTGQLYISTDSKALQRYNGSTWDNVDLLPDLGVSTAKIAANAVTEAKISTSVAGNGLAGGGGSALSVNVDGSTITISADTLGVPASGITSTQLATSVAGNGLGGGGGSALSVNVDDSTIEISSDTLQVKDGGITEAKLASAVVDQLGLNIGIVAKAQVAGPATVVNYSGQGRLLGVGWTTNSDITITVDGVTLYSGGTVSSNVRMKFADHTSSSILTPDSASGELSNLDIFFRTSLVVSTSSSGTVSVVYEREA